MNFANDFEPDFTNIFPDADFNLNDGETIDFETGEVLEEPEERQNDFYNYQDFDKQDENENENENESFDINNEQFNEVFEIDLDNPDDQEVTDYKF